jgi:hypothetical protein
MRWNASFLLKKYYPTTLGGFIGQRRLQRERKTATAGKIEGGDYFSKTRRA